MSQPTVVRLTGRAARYVQLLQDFGHLDDEGVARVLLGAADPLARRTTVDVDLVRRAAAVWLFEQDDGQVDGLLAEDWPLLFT